MTGTSLAVFGVNEFAARLPSVVGSFLGLAGVALLAFRLHGEKAAWWACWFSPTTLQCWALARLLSPDMLLCGLCTLAAGCCLGGFPVLDSAGGAQGDPVESRLVGTRRRPVRAALCAQPWPCISPVDKTFWRGCVRFRLFLTILILGSPVVCSHDGAPRGTERLLLSSRTGGARSWTCRWQVRLSRFPLCHPQPCCGCRGGRLQSGNSHPPRLQTITVLE